MSAPNELTTLPIPLCIRKIAVPASVGFFFHTMFNVVDTYYAGLIGTTAQAALSLAFPVFFIVIAFGSGLQVGATALIGNALGAGRKTRASGFARQGLSFGLCTAALLTVVGLASAPFMFSVLGAEGRYLQACLQYMTPIFAGTIFPMLLYVFNGVLQSQGDTKSFRNVLVTTALANVGLDPWFIYGGMGLPAMGITGIAVATVLTQAAGAVYLGFKARRTGLYARRPGVAPWRPKLQYVAELTRQSLPASFNYVTMGLGIFIITYFVARYGQSVVAAYGVATRAEQILLMPSIGLNIAALTLSAQNYGAGRMDRVRETRSKCLLYGAWLMGAGGLILFAGARPMMQAFSQDPAVLAQGARYLRIAAFLLYAYVVLFVHVSTLQGLKRPMFAVWMGIYRQIAAPIVAFGVCSMLLGLDVIAIWWSIFGVNLSAALFAWVYVRQLLSRLDSTVPPGHSSAPGGTS